MKYDLAIAYTWIYDIEFTRLIEKLFQSSGLTTYIVGAFNIEEFTEAVKNNRLEFKAYLDRASDEDEKFVELSRLLIERKTRIINDYDKTEKAVDKSVMHPKLLRARIKVPKTIIIPPNDEEPELKIKGLDKIGKPFIIKPAYYSGGSEGVVKDAESVETIRNTRQQYPDDSYLVQEKIYPKELNGKRAWFRPLYAFGNIILNYWDDVTHLYYDLTEQEFNEYKLGRLVTIVNKVSELSGLDYFSCEIALTEQNRFYLIDYVNDQCDMRLKSGHYDGVPDHVVEKFILHMMEFVRNI